MKKSPKNSPFVMKMRKEEPNEIESYQAMQGKHILEKQECQIYGRIRGKWRTHKRGMRKGKRKNCGEKKRGSL